MERIFELVDGTDIPESDPYIAAYPALRDYFNCLKEIKADDVIRGAHMVYGWMPTVLSLNTSTPDEGRLERAATMLNSARRGIDLKMGDLAALAKLVNNSVVGASKLLHFAAPDFYAIWDSKVCRFVTGSDRTYHQQVNDVQKYMTYIERLKVLQKHRDFKGFHAKVNTKVKYEVSPLRALELVMFLNAPKTPAMTPEKRKKS